MILRLFPSVLGTAAVAVILLSTNPATEPAFAIELPDIVVTPDRGATDTTRIGSAVTVIGAEEIERSGATTLSELIETSPGVSITRSGGPASATSVRLRGAEPGHTLVLIDGMPVNDPSRASGGFNFEFMSLEGVERVEILRGPQSALYGSEAIGGVINIITKKGSGPPKLTLSGEGGSYGTHRLRAGVTGGLGALSITAGVGRIESRGFSSFSVGTEDDGYERLSGYARIGLKAGDYVNFDLSLKAEKLRSEYDTTTFCCGVVEDDYEVRGHMLSGRASMTVKLLDDAFTSRFATFATESKRIYDEAGTLSSYRGQRVGVEYQGTVALGAPGTTVFGTGIWEETIRTTGFSTLNESLSHYDFFALHKLTLMDRLHLSFGGRYDHFSQSGGFITYRATAALELFDNMTKLRASIGSGARAPTGFQLFDPTFGNPALKAEESFGIDGGIDQRLFDGRARVSVTGFYNEFSNLIDYFDPDGFLGPIPGSYVNIASAETYGVEVSAAATLITGVLDATASYTFLKSKDLSTGGELPRRPNHTGSVSLIYTGIENLRLQGKATYVGEKYNSTDFISGLPKDPIDDYVRVDLYGNYKINDTIEVFGRVENLFDVRYEEVTGYNTPGFSAYLGVKLTN